MWNKVHFKYSKIKYDTILFIFEFSYILGTSLLGKETHLDMCSA